MGNKTAERLERATERVQRAGLAFGQQAEEVERRADETLRALTGLQALGKSLRNMGRTSAELKQAYDAFNAAFIAVAQEGEG